MAYKAIFLDRDDTLIEDPGYINDPDVVKLLPGVTETLGSLNKMGYKLVVVTNQSAVARGIVSEEVLEEIHQRLETLLARGGVTLDAIYYCPYHPDGAIGKYRRESDLRKPGPGMILAAARDLNIDLEQSWMLGNSYSDITAGSRAGCGTILISSSAKLPERGPDDAEPDKIAVNIKEAANIIKMYERKRRAANSRNLRRQQAAVSRGTQADEGTRSNSQRNVDEKIDDIIEESGTTEELETSKTATVVKTEVAESEGTSASAGVVEKLRSISKRTYSKAGKAAGMRQQTGGANSRTTGQEQESAEDADEFSAPVTTQKVLEDVVRYLRKVDRLGMYDEFSLVKVLAGVAQVVVLFCLLLSVWFLLDPTRNEASVHTILGYAVVLQLMVIAFYLMRDRR